MQKYLKEDHEYADLFSDVWLWDEWPERGSRTDAGADLMAKERYSSNKWAIQAKFYDAEVTLQNLMWTQSSRSWGATNPATA